MNQERYLNFGKYKGQEIKYIILTHIGYIMWCFENISWFKLTDEEQAIYDAIAIMIKKYDMQMTFPVELMYKYIKNREAFEKLDTPFVEHYGYTCLKKDSVDNPIYKSVEKYRGDDITIPNLSLGGLRHLSHVANKVIEEAYSDGETDEAIYGGWYSMNNYKD